MEILYVIFVFALIYSSYRNKISKGELEVGSNPNLKLNKEAFYKRHNRMLNKFGKEKGEY